MQERVDSGKTQDVITHTHYHEYIMNTHGIHNIHLLYSVVPSHLIAPALRMSNRQARHSQLAGMLRSKRSDKRGTHTGGAEQDEIMEG
jgi:hypothetical protein